VGMAFAMKMSSLYDKGWSNSLSNSKVIGKVDDVKGTSVIDDITNLKHKATSGVVLKTNPEKTTTVLGRYLEDTSHIIDEAGIPKSTNFSGNKGGFNLLNTPDELYVSADQFWTEYNKPFLDAAIDRGDDIVMATPINNSTLFNKSGELTGYGREYYYLESKGYSLVDGKMTLRGGK